jgi:hypothetical protein
MRLRSVEGSTLSFLVMGVKLPPLGRIAADSSVGDLALAAAGREGAAAANRGKPDARPGSCQRERGCAGRGQVETPGAMRLLVPLVARMGRRQERLV